MGNITLFVCQNLSKGKIEGAVGDVALAASCFIVGATIVFG
jgi:hypothetical protein